jgi:small subunit ribosomal protein S16
MSVQIRLARHGSKKTPFYRIVVTDTRNPRDGRFIEAVGTFNPNVEPPVVELNQSRVDYWTSKGALASATLDRIIKKRAIAAAAG